MSTLIFLAIFAFVLVKRLGRFGRARNPQLGGRRPTTRGVRRPAQAPDRFRRTAPPPPTGASRRLPTPPAAPPLTVETGSIARPTAPVDDPAEAVVEEVPPPPAPGDPVVVQLPDPDPADDPDPVVPPASTPESAPGDLDLSTTIRALFGRDEPPHVRAAAFDTTYAGRRVEWTVTVVRTARSRRDRRPATRAELVLGYTSERQLFSDRVVAEAYLGPDVVLDRDTEITISGTLASANVYANRLVLDHVEVVAPDPA